MNLLEGENSGVPANGSVSRAVIRLSRAQRALIALRLRPYGLRPEQAAVMLHLWRSPRLRQTDLGAEFRLDSASTTRTVQRLEHAGYVRRRPDPRDGRATLVEPTPAGLALREPVETIWEELSEVEITGFTTDEREQFLALLERATSAIADELEHAEDADASTVVPLPTAAAS